MKSFNFLKSIILVVSISFFRCSNDDSGLTTQVPDEVDTSVLSGNYVGTWTSTTPTANFTGVAVSAKLNYSGTDRLVGEFFISPNFTVCCSAGDNDGTVIIEFDGDIITSFYYNDVIIDCSGIFNGSGEIRKSDRAFVIDFTGSDCDGDHVGQIILAKQS